MGNLKKELLANYAFNHCDIPLTANALNNHQMGKFIELIQRKCERIDNDTAKQFREFLNSWNKIE